MQAARRRLRTMVLPRRARLAPTLPPARRLVLGLAVVALTALGAAACGSDGEPGTPAASEPSPVTDPPRSTTTEALTPEEEVEAAYLRSWDVYAEAVRELDPSGLEESYTGDALDLISDEVAELRTDDTPIVVQVDHDLSVQVLDDTRAVVVDEYVNRNYRIDGETGDPIDDPDDPGTYVETYQMERVEGTWLVARIVRESYQP